MLPPACITRLTLEFPVAVAKTKLLLTVIKSVACNIIVEPAEIPEKLPLPSGLRTVVEDSSSEKSSDILLPAVKPVELESTPDNSVILVGSRRTVPASPLSAATSTLPSKSRYCFPEVSTNPPLPNWKPPLAEIPP